LRAGVLLLLVRVAIAHNEVVRARAFAAAIEPSLYRERARLALARGAFERRADISEALRLARQVRDPRLVAERQLLLGEIRLAIRPHVERRISLLVDKAQLARARVSPAWTELEPRPDLKCHFSLIRATAWARFGLREQDPDSFESALYHLIDAGTSRPARRALLAIMRRSYVDAETALLAIRAHRRGHVVDAYLAELAAQRAEELAQRDTPEPLQYGVAGATPPTSDARALERALYDEGVALSPKAANRRRVLISTAQTCLRSAMTEPNGWSRDVVDARLRTLAHLDGSLALEAIRVAVDTLPLDKSTVERALEALCALEPRTAAAVLFARLREIHALGFDLDRILHRIELAGGVPRGFAHAYRRAFDRVAGRHGLANAPAWLADLVAIWRRETSSAPDPIALDAISRNEALPSTARAFVDQLDAHGGILLADGHDRIIDKIAASPDVLASLMVARPARIDPQMHAWAPWRWNAMFRYILDRSDWVEHTTLVECAELLGLSHYMPLRLGALPRIGITPIVSFRADGRDYRLRFLDKRLDLLTYLRFADVPARSCYRSDSRYYRASPYTEYSVISAWKDPLTFCFHVERQVDRHSTIPVGFLFGCFARIGTGVGVVLNSLHVRPNSDAVRIAAIRAFEDALVKPLAIEHVGIANAHGGYGALPANYVRRAESIVRLRALARDGKRLHTAYDDISYTANTRVTVQLYWRS
jgi:hypothetical protein